jgi:hypothetical protein
MSPPPPTATARPGRPVTLAALFATLLSGCARDALRPPRAPGSTIGSDRWTVPPGRTIPPPSLGVDLVRAD